MEDELEEVVLRERIVMLLLGSLLVLILSVTLLLASPFLIYQALTGEGNYASDNITDSQEFE